MSVVIIDWRALGGVARTTLAWAATAERHGALPTVITPQGRELVGSQVIGVDARSRLGRFVSHLDLVQLSIDYIKRHAPRVVVLQNYVMPNEEQRVADAARKVGARLVMVPFIERPHPMMIASSYGLRRLLRTATDVVAHSEYVAQRLPTRARQRIQVVPLPPPELTTHVPGQELSGGVDLALGAHGATLGGAGVVVGLHRALMIGRLGRQSSAGRTLDQLAVARPDRWCITALGAHEESVDRGVVSFPAAPARRDLYATVRASRAVLVPQRLASQSSAVPMAHRLGAVPVVTDVGGLAQQVLGGDAGILLPRHASATAWGEALERLDDDHEFERLRANGYAAADEASAAFEKAVGALVA